MARGECRARKTCESWRLYGVVNALPRHRERGAIVAWRHGPAAEGERLQIDQRDPEALVRGRRAARIAGVELVFGVSLGVGRAYMDDGVSALDTDRINRTSAVAGDREELQTHASTTDHRGLVWSERE